MATFFPQRDPTHSTGGNSWVIVLEDVSEVFASGGRNVTAVDYVSFDVAAGELCVLIGSSGSG